MLMKFKNSRIQAAGALAFLALFTLGSFPAIAEPTIEWIGPNYPSDINADGSVVVGNTADGLYETFRWTEEVGVVRLGLSIRRHFRHRRRNPGCIRRWQPRIGHRQHCRFHICNSRTVDQGEGWAFSMPPSLPDGVVLDGGLGSAWGLSGDGTTLTGFYWRETAMATVQPTSTPGPRKMVLWPWAVLAQLPWQ